MPTCLPVKKNGNINHRSNIVTDLIKTLKTVPIRASLAAHWLKKLPAKVRDTGSITELGRPFLPWTN